MEYNEYDKEAFFNQYKQMSRSTDGLKGAGEWHELQKLLPDFSGKDVLDLGCGFGWHCKYAVDRGARRALGIDLSANMLEEAKKRNFSDRIEYRQCGILEYEYPVSYTHLPLYRVKNPSSFNCRMVRFKVFTLMPISS